MRHLLVLTLCCAGLPASAQSSTTPAVPQLSLDLVAGPVYTRIGSQPALHAALGVRLGSPRPIVPVLGLELGAFGTGYRRNLAYIRSDGTNFSPPELVGAYLGSVGARASPSARFLLTARIGAGRVAPWRSTARFIDADAGVRVGASGALLIGTRSLAAHDPDAAQTRRLTSVTVGVRFLSDP